MGVTKYCSYVHNIGVSKTIQFGTFVGYGLDKNSPLYDPKEGISDASHISPDKFIKITAKQCNSYTNGLVKIISTKGGNPSIRIRNCYNGRSFRLPNCYVFCCSKRSNDYKLMEKLGYSSSFDIPDMSLFCNIITSIFKKRIKDIPFPENYKVKAKWEKVTYTNKLRVVDPSRIQFSDYAIKDTQFDYEDEYRLIFKLITTSGDILSVPPEPLKLDVNDELRNCCIWNKKIIIRN